ncbi:hypothetical protein DSM112329_03726 [Paraconexibacter sp. AEG42_29]|uniref:hypothetical protein n=1 Tax=Paraconexibacter sp. AEG42_29 TaxID=2997339 RepID=UPI00339D7C0E
MTPITEPGTTDGQPVTEQAQEKLKDGAEAAKEQAANVTQQAQARAREQVETRTTDAGEKLKGSAGDARSMAEHLRSEGKDGPARLVEDAADRAEKLGGYLSEADADQLIRDLEDFGRKNPWAVIAGGIAVGFLAARAVSASSAGRDQVGTTTSSSTGNGARGLPAAPSADTAPRPAADTPRAAADAAVGEGYSDTDGVPANADLPGYGGSR